MKTRLFSLLGIFGLLLQTASAQSVLIKAYTTTNDFLGWSDNSGGTFWTVSSTTSTDLDNVTINGVGGVAVDAGPSIGGATGTPGAVSLTWKPAAGNYSFIYSTGEQGNPTFLDAITATTNLTLKCTTPTNNDGNYFQLGLVFNYSSHFDQIFPIDSTTDGNGVTTETFDLTTEAATIAAQRAIGMSYFQFGLIYNSNYSPSNSPFYVDDIVFYTTNTPPTLSITKATPPGLTVFDSALLADGTLDAGQRQSIATRGSFPWVGSPGNTVYSMTLASFPDTQHSNFQAHMFLVGNLPANNTGPAADFNDTNVVFLRVEQNSDGTAQGLLMFKTNAAGSFPYFGNILAAANSSKVLGTWSLTFNQDTNITVRAADGTTVTCTLDAATAAQFAGNLTAYFGIQPNDATYARQSATFSNIKITTNSVVGLNDDFTVTPLNVSGSGLWRNRSQNAGGVTVVTPNSAFWIDWNPPNFGFTLQTNSNLLATGSWGNPGLTTFAGADLTRALVTTNSFPSAAKGFYRLINSTTP